MAFLPTGQDRKLVLFNGPRHSGKDTAAWRCVHTFDAYHFKMSAPIKAAIGAAFQLTYEDVQFLESIKTQPSELFFGKSYVEMQISFSEDWLKPLFDNYVFGHLALRAVTSAINDHPDQGLYVCSDSGFAEEAFPLVDLFGKKNVLLVHLQRDDKDFSGDSRSYIHLDGVPRVTISNNGSVDAYHGAIDDVVGSFLAGEQSPF